jgi:N-methylhydantoinase A
MGYVIGVDIGGTFTDCVVVHDGAELTIGKALSTGPEFHEGFLASIAAAAERVGVPFEQLVSEASGIYHGCTVATNAMVEGRTAKVGLLTTRGHRDVMATMRAGRRMWNSSPDYIAHLSKQSKPAPLVPKALIEEIDERVAVDGSVVVALDEEKARESIQRLVDAGVEALSISLLWSVANDAHERRLAELVEEIAPGMFTSVASSVVSRTGEYERTIAAAVNSLVGPVMKGYLAQVEERLKDLGYSRTLQIMTCSGGVVTAADAARLPLLTIGSGPVGGLIGAGTLGRAVAGSEGDRTDALDILTADMGGTTLDVGVIREGQPLTRATSWHGQFEYYVPTLDVRSIGAGGGSIIRYDEDMGTLRVGPESAGSRPGPACYRRGGEAATVTDANVVLGYVNPDNFLGGEMELDVDAAIAALKRAGEPIGYDAEQTALAAVQIVESQMADAIRLASVEQGYDPRGFSLYAYGGAGPLHGAALARELKIGQVVVPLSDLAAGWSAFGIASSDVLVVEELAVSMLSPFDPNEFNDVWARLEDVIRTRVTSYDVDPDSVLLSRTADMRYRRQVNEVEVPAPTGVYEQATVDELVGRFEREYARIFGEDTGYAAAGFTTTSLRLRATAPTGEFDLTAKRTNGTGVEAARRGDRAVLLDAPGARVQVAVYDGQALPAGASVEGAAILEFPDTSVVVHEGMRARIDPYGSVVVEL